MPVPEEIKRAFASGATILTANVRAARWLQREYALEQRNAGRRAWSTPPIEAWGTWLGLQWEERALIDPDAPLLLTSLQERSVWARVQREDAALLVSSAKMALLAESAYALLSNYEAHAERRRPWGRTDAERFRQWAASFDRECVERNWLPRAGLETKVAAALNPAALPREILLVGFDRTTPAQETLLRMLASYGVSVRLATSEFRGAKAEFIRAAGLREEITACAWWARAMVEKNPETRIGVLVPDVSNVRGEMERIFRRILMPQTDNIFAEEAMPFEFSLGQPLANVPAVRAALLLLRWLDRPLREEEISWLLLSGFLSPGDDDLAVAKLDAKNRDSGQLSLEIGLHDFLKQSEKQRAPLLTKLANAHRMAEANRLAEEERLPGRWADLGQLLLREAGWPGATERDTLHFQAMRRWEHALDEIALLSFDGHRTSYEHFLHELEAHALETIFSPESQGAPVQIMGALEASGQQFDALWFLSADDASWPPHGRAHPLIPNDVQRRFRMPYADPESDLELARAITNRIASSAPVIVFSHAERNKDGELRPSPLLPQNAEWRAIQTAPTQSDHWTEQLNELEDASERIAWPQDRVAGGADVLKQQAACPFQAFGRKRLRAEPLNRSDWGLSAAERGKLLHRTLEKIWSLESGALHSLDDLQVAIREKRLTDILKAAIEEAFSGFGDVEDTWMRAYLTSERRRLLLRLEEWMSEEAARAPFDVIACEKKLDDVNVGGLKLRLRADRIDGLPDGRLLIDYKSGEITTKDWEPPRPNEPQLPLYAVFGGVENVRGVLFGQIRAGKTGFVGSVAKLNPEPFPRSNANPTLTKEPYSESMRDEWREALLTLADEFQRGEAAVDPKLGKKTCEFCPLPGLCRVAEMRNPLVGALETEGNSADE